MKRTLVITGLLVVLTCGAAVTWAYHRTTSEPPYDARRAGLRSLEMKIQAYYLDTSALPHSLENLLKADGATNWRGPYAKSRDLVDPWGRPFAYESVESTPPRFRLSAVDASGKPVLSEISP